MASFFFDGWSGVQHVVVTGLAVYLLLIIALRVLGNRALAKLNAYGLVVTVALGSTLAAALLNGDLAVVESLSAIALLLAFQFLFGWAASRWRWAGRLLEAEPELLAYRGEILDYALRDSRISGQAVRAAVRGQGHASLSEVEAVVLESNGSLSVVGRIDRDDQDGEAVPSALADVEEQIRRARNRAKT